MDSFSRLVQPLQQISLSYSECCSILEPTFGMGGLCLTRNLYFYFRLDTWREQSQTFRLKIEALLMTSGDFLRHEKYPTERSWVATMSVQSRRFRKVVIRRNPSTVAKVMAKTVNQPVLAHPASTIPVSPLSESGLACLGSIRVQRLKPQPRLKVGLSSLDSSKPAPSLNLPSLTPQLAQSSLVLPEQTQHRASEASTCVTSQPASSLSRPWTPSADPVRISPNNRLASSSSSSHPRLILESCQRIQSGSA